MSTFTQSLGALPWILGVIILAVILFTIFITSYRKVRPNEVLIVTGAFLKEPKTVSGSGAWVIPGLQQGDYLDLSAFTVKFNIKSSSVTQVPLFVKGTATLNIGKQSELVNTAASKFLGVDEEERNSQLTEIIEGQTRGILGKMRPEDAVNKKEEFSKEVKMDLKPLLETLGVEIVSVQINDVTDDQGYIESLYAEDVANKRAAAEKARAKADADARVSAAEQDRLAKQAEQASLRQIAEEEKTTAIAKAKYKEEQDAAQAIADTAYEISRAESRKVVVEKEGAINSLQAEKDADVAAKRVEIRKQELEAEIIAQTNAQSQANKITAETNAKTRVINAEAEKDTAALEAESHRVKTVTDAKAKAESISEMAKADAEAQRVRASAEAESISSKGKAEAESIEAKGKAEAAATREMAHALTEQGQAVLAQMIIERLPELAKEIAAPMSNIDSMTVFNGAQGVTGQAMETQTQVFEFVKSALGIDLSEVITNKGKGLVTVDAINKVVSDDKTPKNNLTLVEDSEDE